MSSPFIDEILVTVFEFYAERGFDLCRIGEVNKQFYAISRCNYIWRRFFRECYGDRFVAYYYFEKYFVLKTGKTKKLTMHGYDKLMDLLVQSQAGTSPRNEEEDLNPLIAAVIKHELWPSEGNLKEYLQYSGERPKRYRGEQPGEIVVENDPLCSVLKSNLLPYLDEKTLLTLREVNKFFFYSVSSTNLCWKYHVATLSMQNLEEKGEQELYKHWAKESQRFLNKVNKFEESSEKILKGHDKIFNKSCRPELHQFYAFNNLFLFLGALILYIIYQLLRNTKGESYFTLLYIALGLVCLSLLQVLGCGMGCSLVEAYEVLRYFDSVGSRKRFRVCYFEQFHFKRLVNRAVSAQLSERGDFDYRGPAVAVVHLGVYILFWFLYFMPIYLFFLILLVSVLLYPFIALWSFLIIGVYTCILSAFYFVAFIFSIVITPKVNSTVRYIVIVLIFCNLALSIMLLFGVLQITFSFLYTSNNIILSISASFTPLYTLTAFTVITTVISCVLFTTLCTCGDRGIYQRMPRYAHGQLIVSSCVSSLTTAATTCACVCCVVPMCITFSVLHFVSSSSTDVPEAAKFTPYALIFTAPVLVLLACLSCVYFCTPRFVKKVLYSAWWQRVGG